MSRDWWGGIAFAVLSLLGLIFGGSTGYMTYIFPALLIITFTVTNLLFTRRATGILLAVASGAVPAYTVIFSLEPTSMIYQYAIIACFFAMMEFAKRHSSNDMGVFLEYLTRIGEGTSVKDASLPALELIREVIPGTFPGLALFDETREEFRIITGPLDSMESDTFPAREGSISWRAYSTGKPQVIDDVRDDPDYVPGLPDARSEVTVPITWKDRKFGVLNIESPRVARFSKRDVRNLSFLAALLGEVFAHIEAQQEMVRSLEQLDVTRSALEDSLSESRVQKDDLEQLLRKLRSLFRIAEELSICVFAEGLFPKLTALLVETMNYHNVFIFAKTSVEEKITFRAHKSSVEEDLISRESLECYRRLVEHVSRTGQPWWYPNLNDADRGVLIPEKTGSALAVPVKSQEEVWGVLIVDDREEEGLSPRDLELLTISSSHLALELESRDAVGKVNLQVSRLRGLHSVVQGLSLEYEEPRELCRYLVKELSTRFGFEKITLFLMEEETGKEVLVPVASNFLQDGELSGLRVKLENAGGGLVYQSAIQRKVINTPDTSRSPLYFSIKDARTQAELDVPIMFKEKLYGVLSVETSEPLDERAQELFLILSRHVGTLLRIQEILKEAETRALVDELTGLWNRRYLFARIEQEKYRLERHGGTMALVMVDMAGFKDINDTYGHVVGDQVLKEFASILRKTLRNSDEVGRYGGDEFLILLPETGYQDISRVIARIEEECDTRELAHLPDGLLRADFGYAVYPGDADDLVKALQLADERMYISKHGRKGMKP